LKFINNSTILEAHEELLFEQVKTLMNCVPRIALNVIAMQPIKFTRNRVGVKGC